jgi:hypothetical protein
MGLSGLLLKFLTYKQLIAGGWSGLWSFLFPGCGVASLAFEMTFFATSDMVF